MSCIRALNPPDDDHPAFEKANGDMARFSVIATRIGKGKRFALEHPARIEKIQPPPVQRCLALRGIAGDLHIHIVYTNRVGVTRVLGSQTNKVFE